MNTVISYTNNNTDISAICSHIVHLLVTNRSHTTFIINKRIASFKYIYIYIYSYLKYFFLSLLCFF